jgi:hypothetical protein
MTADASPTVELSTLTSNVPEALPSPIATSMTFTTDPQQTLLITNFECLPISNVYGGRVVVRLVSSEASHAGLVRS